jgi:hypothetical protein
MFEASRKANAGRFWTCQSHMGDACVKCEPCRLL